MKTKNIVLLLICFTSLVWGLAEFNYQIAYNDAQNSCGSDSCGEQAFYERGFIQGDFMAGTPSFLEKINALNNFIFVDLKYFEHICNWVDCDQQGKSNFESHWNNPEGSTGWQVEEYHFYNPSLSYEQCEEVILLGNN